MKTLQQFICLVLCGLMLCTPYQMVWADDGFDFSGGGEEGGGEEGGGEEGGGDGFDFSGGGEGGGGEGGGGGDDGFDFSNPDEKDPNGGGGQTFTPPSGDQPLVMSFFYPVDGTNESHLSLLTEALNEHIPNIRDPKDPDSKDAIFGALDGTAMLSILTADDEGANCVIDPICIAQKAGDFGASKVIVGNIETDGRDRPKITLMVYDVKSEALDNVFDFESSSRNPKRQKKELWPAVHKALGMDVPPDRKAKVGDSCTDEGQKWCDTSPLDLRCTEVVAEDGSGTSGQFCVLYEKPFFTTGQLIAVITTGVAGLAFIGAGVGLGLSAQSTEEDVLSKIDSQSINQVDARNQLDDASSQALIANIMYGLGAAALATSIVLIFIRPGEETESAEQRDGQAELDFYLEPQFGTEGAGFIGGFHF